MKKTNKDQSKNDNKSEYASEKSAKDISWELFQKTGSSNYYNFFSSLKNDKKDK